MLIIKNPQNHFGVSGALTFIEVSGFQRSGTTGNVFSTFFAVDASTILYPRLIQVGIGECTWGQTLS